MKIAVDSIRTKRIEEEPVEIVERKGLGHPDTICDAIAEEFSISLSNFYIEKFGRILHHNVDKALLVGGRALPTFGGGELLEPIKFILVGRVTMEFEGTEVPAEELYKESAHRWIKENFRFLDPEKHIVFDLLIRPGSPDLTSLFLREGEAPLANDTSFGVGYAPLSKLERAVLNLEKHINSGDFKNAHPEVGEDVKVMGIRKDSEYFFTVSIAFNSRLISSLNDYIDKKQRVREELERYLSSILDEKFTIVINAADDEESESVYITLTGTSAEGGDDGQVGRGNRANGLITPMRPMSLEALSGKNPISHVGKLYNVVARSIAERLTGELDEVEEAYVYLVSEIGSPITRPQLSLIKMRTNDLQIKPSLKEESERILKEELEKMPSLYKDLIARKLPLY